MKGKVMLMVAYLVLEDGAVYEGTPRGAFKETVCEVVFNTSMTGYLELLSDPSCIGQGIVMTYPLIGNYGANREDMESSKFHPSAFIIHELCDTPSNFRSTSSLEEFLIEFDIPCLTNVDTRSIVKNLRENGTMRGIITTDISDMHRLKERIHNFKQDKLLESVSVDGAKIYGEDNNGAKIALMDFGVKRSIINALVDRGCKVTQYPFHTQAQEILSKNYDGVLLSSGPGNPQDCVDIIKEIAKIYDYGIPTFAICQGHLLMAHSQGGKSCRMKYGHRGANHPVKFLNEDRTYLTSQNHGYTVVAESLPKGAEVNCINVNDNTVEGIVYHGKPMFTVQFHPEASSGPLDTSFLFDRFIKMIGEGRYNDR